jgi:NAD(P)-dependent dehydrogenase (short-subunit alcohol dehydrogenase family)
MASPGNRGLGLAVSKELAARGKSVVLTARDAAAGAGRRGAARMRRLWAPRGDLRGRARV